MIPNHHQLLRLLAHAEPAFLAGSFDTRFTAAPDQEGERGSFLYFEGGFWDIRIHGATRFLLTPWGSRVTQPNGAEEDGPAMTNAPRRPPWSLALPRHSTFLGREDDDWQLDADTPVTADGSAWAVALTSLEAPRYHGTLTIDPETHVITRVELRHLVQKLTIDRTEPTEEDVAALTSLKSAVKRFSGSIEHR
jgi:hypothetical protein